MRIERADPTEPKGWYFGPWNSDLAVSVGYANEGINEPHLHTRITEIYMVARGTSVLRVEGETITLYAGDVIAVEPGEAHTFLSSTPDYFHFVIHTPGLAGEEARQEKRQVIGSQLGWEPRL
jgi:mannose-6-phosphate isomerase-like protein (cupin superfamily)